MRVIIAGSRGLQGSDLIQKAVQASGFQVDTVLSGCARGIDFSGAVWAVSRAIPVERYPAKWSELGASAGFQRNLQMVAAADAAIVIWDGQSKGAHHLACSARAAGLPVRCYSPRR